MAKENKRAKLKLSGCFIHSLLNLPDDVEVVGFYQNDADNWTLLLEGDGVPDYPEVNAICQVTTVSLEPAPDREAPVKPFVPIAKDLEVAS